MVSFNFSPHITFIFDIEKTSSAFQKTNHSNLNTKKIFLSFNFELSGVFFVFEVLKSFQGCNQDNRLEQYNIFLI